MPYSAGGYYPSFAAFLGVDPSLSPTGVFVAASDPGRQRVGVAELNGSPFVGILWGIDAGIMSEVMLPSVRASWPGAAAGCSSGFGYAAMSGEGSMVFVEQGLGFVSSDSFLLGDTNATDVTSMAAAADGDAGLLIAVSTGAQIAVYRVGCQ